MIKKQTLAAEYSGSNQMLDINMAFAGDVGQAMLTRLATGLPDL